jgi:hypothetical protein
MIVAALAIASLLSLAWMLSLRRRVQQQTRELLKAKWAAETADSASYFHY